MDDAGEKNARKGADIGTTRSDPTLHQEHVAAFMRFGALEQKLGRPVEAERLLMEAIVVGQRHLGADHPSLAAPLNELSRLHIRQGDYARAEPVLERLLQIARAKGDRHPDVATALAGLAAAKRGLGDDTSAEALYREALRIREEVLAPQHMAIVVTLEQLAETCAARGNVAEALVHLQRALLRRERTLGLEHASVLGLQARIADLERRHSESIAAAAVRLLTPALGVARQLLSPLTRVETSAPALVDDASSTVDAPELLLQSQSGTFARTMPAARTWSRKRTTRFASAAAVVVLAIAGFGFSSAARSETETTDPLPAVETHRAVVTPASNAGSLAAIGAAAPEATPSASDATPMPKDTQPTSNEMRAAVMPDVPAALQRLRRLVVPKVAMPSVDSLVRAAAKVAPDSLSERIAAGGSLLVPAHGDDATVTAPVLITAPTLRFPDELRAQRVEGEVVVQFRVNEKGRVEPSSMRVMQSEHELFTAVVRSALPRFRFEPARSAAPGSKSQSAWVQFRAQFTARN